MNTIEQLIIVLTFFLLLLIGGILFVKQHCFLKKDCAGICGGDTPECDGVCGVECKEENEPDGSWVVLDTLDMTGWVKRETIDNNPSSSIGQRLVIDYSDASIDCVIFNEDKRYATLLNSIHCIIEVISYVNMPLNKSEKTIFHDERDLELNLILPVESCNETTVREWLTNNNILDSLPEDLRENIMSSLQN